MEQKLKKANVKYFVYNHVEESSSDYFGCAVDEINNFKQFESLYLEPIYKYENSITVLKFRDII